MTQKNSVPAALLSFCAAILLLPCAPAVADVLEQTQLTFGRWAVTDNNSQHSITVNTDGSYSTSSGTLVMLSPPIPGLYNVTGLPALHTVGSVVVTVNFNMQAGGGPDFLLDNFTTQIPQSDNAGNTTLTLGARARTNGGGTGYGDDTYVGELHIEINL